MISMTNYSKKHNTLVAPMTFVENSRDARRERSAQTNKSWIKQIHVRVKRGEDIIHNPLAIHKSDQEV